MRIPKHSLQRPRPMDRVRPRHAIQQLDRPHRLVHRVHIRQPRPARSSRDRHHLVRPLPTPPPPSPAQSRSSRSRSPRPARTPSATPPAPAATAATTTTRSSSPARGTPRSPLVLCPEHARRSRPRPTPGETPASTAAQPAARDSAAQWLARRAQRDPPSGSHGCPSRAVPSCPTSPRSERRPPARSC